MRVCSWTSLTVIDKKMKKKENDMKNKLIKEDEEYNSDYYL